MSVLLRFPTWIPWSILALGALLFQGKKPTTPKPLVPFSGSYEEALQRAVDRNVPVLFFAFHEDPDAPHEDVRAFREEIFARADLAALAPLTLVAVGGTGVHDPVPIEVERDGQKTKLQVCSAYRSETCMQHQKLFDSLYKEHNREGELRSPATILLGPDRKLVEIWQSGSAPGWDGVLAALKAAQTKAGEGLTEAQLGEVRALVARGTAELNKEQWGAAYATWGKLLGITSKTKYAEQARTSQARALEAIGELREAARAEIREGRAVSGYKQLIELQGAVAGTPLEKELAREVAALEKDKATKDAIAAYKREQEAEKLWQEAEALTLAKEPKKAEVKVRQLLRKYADTPAGKRARESYPELAADEDQKRAGGGS